MFVRYNRLFAFCKQHKKSNMEAENLEYITEMAALKLPDQLKIIGATTANPYAEEQIHFKFDENCINLIAEYKYEPRLMHLPYLKTKNKEMGPLILVAMHISPRVKEELRKESINCIYR